MIFICSLIVVTSLSETDSRNMRYELVPNSTVLLQNRTLKQTLMVSTEHVLLESTTRQLTRHNSVGTVFFNKAGPDFLICAYSMHVYSYRWTKALCTGMNTCIHRGDLSDVGCWMRMLRAILFEQGKQLQIDTSIISTI